MVKKTYIALVGGVPAIDAGTIELPIRTRRGTAVVAPAGRPARTDWRVAHRGRNRTLLELHPQTGRMHQLRVHLAAIGHPVVGDRRYGGPVAARLMLHAAALELTWQGRALKIEAPLPVEFGAPTRSDW